MISHHSVPVQNVFNLQFILSRTEIELQEFYSSSLFATTSASRNIPTNAPMRKLTGIQPQLTIVIHLLRAFPALHCLPWVFHRSRLQTAVPEVLRA